jgi:hypothetical protein
MIAEASSMLVIAAQIAALDPLMVTGASTSDDSAETVPHRRADLRGVGFQCEVAGV